MLKYFVDTTEALLITGILIGMMIGCMSCIFGKNGSLPVKIGLYAGIVGAVVMAYLKNATRLIDTSLWNLRVFLTCLCALLLFWIFAAIAKKEKKVSPVLAGSFLGLIAAGLLVHALPDILANPYIILMTEKNRDVIRVSSENNRNYIRHIAGTADRDCNRTGNPPPARRTGDACTDCKRSASGCKLYPHYADKTHDNAGYEHLSFLLSDHQIHFQSRQIFSFAILAAAVCVPVLLLVKSLNVKEPYKNNAEHRKIRKKWKVSSRWAVMSVVCTAASVLNITWLKAITSRAVDLAPIEECKIIGHDMVVPFDLVQDGHLHRFAYTTEDNIEIRFIIIKKPNSSSYGIGLDACDICGETGYYEKDGQVVCKLCDVVMNINTIGFKGGCNPIVIPYSIENGSIMVPIDGLLDYKKEFQ